MTKKRPDTQGLHSRLGDAADLVRLGRAHVTGRDTFNYWRGQGLRIHTANCLVSAGIHDVDELRRWHAARLLREPNLGLVALLDICDHVTVIDGVAGDVETLRRVVRQRRAWAAMHSERVRAAGGPLAYKWARAEAHEMQPGNLTTYHDGRRLIMPEGRLVPTEAQTGHWPTYRLEGTPHDPEDHGGTPHDD